MSQSDQESRDKQGPEQPPPGGKPGWLDWWLGRTPEQVEAFERDLEARKKAPIWVKGCVIVVGLALGALIVMSVGWLVVVPTVGFILILGLHRLMTGEWVKPPMPIWMHLAFITLVVLTAICMTALR